MSSHCQSKDPGWSSGVCKCARDGDVRPVGSRKRRQHQIWRDEWCVRGAETGRGYAAGRCYTRALLLAGSVHGTDGVVLLLCRQAGRQASKQQEDVGAMARTSRQMDRRLVGMLCRLQSREGRE